MKKILILVCFSFFGIGLFAQNDVNTVDNNIKYFENKINSEFKNYMMLKQKYSNTLSTAESNIENLFLKYINELTEKYNLRTKKVNKMLTALTESIEENRNRIKDNLSSVNLNTSKIEKIFDNLTKLKNSVEANKKLIKINSIDVGSLKQLYSLKNKVSELNKRLNMLEAFESESKQITKNSQIRGISLQNEINYLSGELEKVNNRVNKIILNSQLYEIDNSHVETVYMCKNGHIGKPGQKFCTICSEPLLPKNRIIKTSKQTEIENLSKPEYKNDLKKFDKNIIESILKRAETEFNMNDFEAALNDYVEILKYDNKNVVALYYAGITSYLLKKYNSAINYFESVVELNSKDVNAHVYLGILYTKLNYLEKAKKVWLDILKMDPNNAIALSNLKKVNNLYDR